MEKRNGGPKGRPRIMRLLPLAAIILLLGAAWASGLFDHLTLASFIRNRSFLLETVQSHAILSFLSYFLLYAALVAVSFPGASLLTIAGGFLFGGLAGGTVTVFAATVGAAAIFLIARSSFGGFLAARAGPFVQRMLKGFHEDEFSYLLTIRLAPVFPFWVVNIVPALLDMKLSRFTLATFLGIIPGTFAYAYVGAGLGSVIEAQERANPGCAAAGDCAIDPSGLVTPEVLAGMAGLAVISILPVAIRKWRRSGRGDNGADHRQARN